MERCIQLGIINAFDINGSPNFTNIQNTYNNDDELFALLVYEYLNYSGTINSQWNHDLFTVLNYRNFMVQDLIGAHSLLNDPTNDFLTNVNNDPNVVGGPYAISELMDYIAWIGLEGTQEYLNTIANNPTELAKKNYVEDEVHSAYTHNCN